MGPILLGQLLCLFCLGCVWQDSWRPRPGSLGREAQALQVRGGIAADREHQARGRWFTCRGPDD